MRRSTVTLGVMDVVAKRTGQAGGSSGSSSAASAKAKTKALYERQQKDEQKLREKAAKEAAKYETPRKEKEIGISQTFIDQYTAFADKNVASFLPPALRDRNLKEARALNFELSQLLKMRGIDSTVSPLEVDRGAGGALEPSVPTGEARDARPRALQKEYRADDLVIQTASVNRVDASKRGLHDPSCPYHSNTKPISGISSLMNLDAVSPFWIKKRVNHLASTHFAVSTSWKSVSGKNDVNPALGNVEQELKSFPTLFTAVSTKYSSIDAFLAAVKTHALNRMGPGFTWIVWNPSSSPTGEGRSGGSLDILNTPNGTTPLELGMWPLACINMLTSAYLTAERDWSSSNSDAKKKQLEEIESGSVPKWSRAARNSEYAKQYVAAVEIQSQSMSSLKAQKERYVQGILECFNLTQLETAIKAARSWYESEEYAQAVKNRAEETEETAKRVYQEEQEANARRERKRISDTEEDEDEAAAAAALEKEMAELNNENPISSSGLEDAESGEVDVREQQKITEAAAPQTSSSSNAVSSAETSSTTEQQQEDDPNYFPYNEVPDSELPSTVLSTKEHQLEDGTTMVQVEYEDRWAQEFAGGHLKITFKEDGREEYIFPERDPNEEPERDENGEVVSDPKRTVMLPDGRVLHLLPDGSRVYGRQSADDDSSPSEE